MILLGEARRPRACFCIADTLAGAAPFGEDLTVVVVGGGERQPVSNPLESVQRKAAVPALPMAFSVRQWSASAVVTLRPSGGFTPPGVGRRQSQRQPRPSFVVLVLVCDHIFAGSGLLKGR